jgi:hypothetical protein
MLTLDDVIDDATARQWYREQWRFTEFASECLDRYQFEALAGVLRFPELAKECTIHLFSSPDGSYVEVFKAFKASGNSPQGAVGRLSDRGRLPVNAELLSSLLVHPVTIWSARQAIGRVMKIISWRYRRQKEGKCKI